MSTTLGAQARQAAAPDRARSAVGFGYTATLGINWQLEAAEVGYFRHYPRGPFGALFVTGRIGTFIDESAVLGESRGVAFAATVGARTKMKQLTHLGEQDNSTAIGVDVTFEGSGYVASGSPFAQGSRWGAIAVLPALRISSRGGQRYGIVIGPTAFFDRHKTTLHALLQFRAEAPLARRERRP